jgi:hypothetical protein
VGLPAARGEMRPHKSNYLAPCCCYVAGIEVAKQPGYASSAVNRVAGFLTARQSQMLAIQIKINKENNL